MSFSALRRLYGWLRGANPGRRYALIATLPLGAAAALWLALTLSSHPKTLASGLTPPPASPTTLPAVITARPPTPAPAPARLATTAAGPQLPDYMPLVNEVNQLIGAQSADVGVAFVDTVTGQAAVMGRADGRFHALSTFKGVLAAYYLFRLERGEIAEGPNDDYHVRQMLGWSSNVDTTCVFRAVGGLQGFNDWLAREGFWRTANWVYAWDGFPCADDGVYWTPPLDLRYQNGDAALGLPGNGQLMVCPDASLPCDNAIQPLQLAIFYARLYHGEVVGSAALRRWLGWMEKQPADTASFSSLPPGAAGGVLAYVKNGSHPVEDDYPVNMYDEAGLLVTPQGAFALAVFVQKSPSFPDSQLHNVIGRLAYEAFLVAHPPAPAGQ